MKTYVYYGEGYWRNTRFVVNAHTKKEAIEIARKKTGCTVSTMKVKKG